MHEQTMEFSIKEEPIISNRDVLKSVYNALKEKGYDPINQLVGYILSEDPTYITTHNNARRAIRSVDRDDLLRDLVRCYLELDKTENSDK
ncbi:MAG: IreB family regulatory phosphoprotein [Oscillospiraceae bacterium]